MVVEVVVVLTKDQTRTKQVRVVEDTDIRQRIRGYHRVEHTPYTDAVSLR